MVKQFIRQSPLRRPSVRLRVIALKIIRILNNVVAVNVTSTGDVEFVIEHRGRMVHPPLLQVGTLDEPVGLGVVGDHPPGVSYERGDVHVRGAAQMFLANTS